MEQVLDILSWFFLVSGGLIGVIGAIGLIRLPDLYCRMHAAGMIDTLAVAFLIFGMMLQTDSWLIAVKLFVILAFIFFTSPTSTHALAKAALHGGLKPLTDDADQSLTHQPSEALPGDSMAEQAEPEPSNTSST